MMGSHHLEEVSEGLPHWGHLGPFVSGDVSTALTHPPLGDNGGELENQ